MVIYAAQVGSNYLGDPSESVTHPLPPPVFGRKLSRTFSMLGTPPSVFIFAFQL